MENVLQLDTATVHHDATNQLVVVKFLGDVSSEDYKGALLKAAEMVEKRGVKDVMMNRLEIGQIPPDGRVWVKNVYLKEVIKPLVKRLNKVAIIESQSVVAQLYGKAIYSSFKLIYPHLSFKVFSNIDSGMNWIVDVQDQIESKKPVREVNPSVQKPEPAQLEEVLVEPIPEDAKQPELTEVQKESVIDKLFSMFSRK